VQLTKDHVPVIYHDFLVCETGIDSPMHTLTYEQASRITNGGLHSNMILQFRYISDAQSAQRANYSITHETECFKVPLSRRVRSRSLNPCDDTRTEDFMARVKHTFDYNSRGIKGNTRGDTIHDQFITLEQLLTTLPLSIGMDIEISMFHFHFLPLH
jgi:glycerophosphoryl diester phosphodiesterase